jgi:branched-chain amino acid transport system ATP-binding protein
MALLEARALTKAFGALIAVNQVDLVIEKGMIHSIIGPNGAGKTTLFNLLAGVYTPNSGAIIFQGKDITTLKVHERSHIGIGRSYQVTCIFPELSIRENVRLAVQSRGKHHFSLLRKFTSLKDVEEKTSAILDEMGLKRFEGQKAGTIPYGGQRSLEVAIALATEPVLLLLDEPTSGMAIEDIPMMIDLIKKVSKDYTTVLIEHHMNVVMSISDKITVLHQGRIIAEGPPEFVQNSELVRCAYLGDARTW